MRDLLNPRNRRVLRQIIAQQALLAFDFDGTLAPLIDQPEAAAMRASTRHLLGELAERRHVAVISGRAVADLRPRLAGVAVAAVIGSHGIEPSPEMEPAHAAVTGWLPVLQSQLGAIPGLFLEDKRFSVAIHYRHAPADATTQIDRAVADLGAGVRRIDGTAVLNLVPEGMPTKGDALRRLQREFGASAALYIGDEPTDEDAFAVVRDEGSVGIRIGRVRGSAARYFVEAQADVDAVLELLLAAASGSIASPAADRADERNHRTCPSES